MFAGTVLSAASAGFVRFFRKTTHLTLLGTTQILTDSRYSVVIATALYLYSSMGRRWVMCEDPGASSFKDDQVCRWNGFGNVNFRKFAASASSELFTHLQASTMFVLQSANSGGIRFYPRSIPRFQIHCTLRSCGQCASGHHIASIHHLQRAFYDDARESRMGELRT